MITTLFICSANKDRSKTAEDYFSAQYPDLSFDSAGTNKKTCAMLGTNYITDQQLELTDVVYVMEEKHAKKIKSLFGNRYYHKITVLHIKDVYQYGSKELIEILEEKISL